VNEIAQALEIAPDEVKESLKSSSRHVSMDAPITNEDEGSMYDVLSSKDTPSPDKGLITDSLRKEIERALSTLTHREANIIRLYYGLNGKHAHTLEEIGEEFNLTRERVRQIKEKAIKRLKNITRSKNLKTYLG
jgi:RNA polymerase primary sigma factor